jgi:Restriction endonuclease
MTNTGIPYEKVSKTIFEKALQRQDVENLAVEHDAHIQGRTVEHQIDVYWRFKVAGVEYQTVVQCKDWQSAVPQGAVFTFACVIDDIPGQPRGIMIARAGFQDGAKKVAAAKGIKLYTLREPATNGDWEGLIRQIDINIEVTVPHVEDLSVEFDDAWFHAEQARLSVAQGETIELRMAGSTADPWTCDMNGQPLQTGQEILDSLFREHKSSETPQRVRHVFPDQTYMYASGDPRFPRVKVVALSCNMSHIAYGTHHLSLKADDITSYILTDVLSGEKTAIDRDLEMILAKNRNGTAR